MLELLTLCGTLCAVLTALIEIVLLSLFVFWLASDRPTAGPTAEPAAEPPVTPWPDDVVAEARAAFAEAAAHRFPGLHADEALERYIQSVISINYWYRDEARKKAEAEAEKKAEAEAEKKAAAEKKAEAYQTFEFTATFGPDVERYG